ncbi:hypothetical protein [Crocinitomix catalasitica]|uniref:hypothetical protein n=1 Tax=Crocinitomix catalasitica TaxID=184607 RepID=UPI000489A90B|nr:hypothetical protein [Crocinitomix catalasitica]
MNTPTRLSLLLLICVSAIVGNAQTDQFKIDIGAGISGGLITENTQTLQANAFVGLNLPSKKFQIRLDGYYFIDSWGDRPRFQINHQAYLGVFYNLPFEKIIPYVGIQGGIAYSQSSEYGVTDVSTGEIDYQKTINPLISGIVGANYPIAEKINIFAQLRYISGRHQSDTYPIYLDELRFSLGAVYQF